MSEDSSAAGTDNRPPMLEEMLRDNSPAAPLWPTMKQNIAKVRVLQILIKSSANIQASNNSESRTSIAQGQTIDPSEGMIFLMSMERFLALKSKYVTNVKNAKDMSTVSYVDLFTHLRSYEEHAMKTLRKQEQSSSVAEPICLSERQTLQLYYPTKCPPPTPIQHSLQPVLAPQSSSPLQKVECNQTWTWFHNQRKDKAMLLQTKEKGVVLDANPNISCCFMWNALSLYAEPLALNPLPTHVPSQPWKMPYDLDVDDELMHQQLSMANLSSSSIRNNNYEH
ncbi:hypothetical protein Tco_0638612 [Tanacetum coccineum]